MPDDITSYLLYINPSQTGTTVQTVPFDADNFLSGITYDDETLVPVDNVLALPLIEFNGSRPSLDESNTLNFQIKYNGVSFQSNVGVVSFPEISYQEVRMLFYYSPNRIRLPLLAYDGHDLFIGENRYIEIPRLAMAGHAINLFAPTVGTPYPKIELPIPSYYYGTTSVSAMPIFQDGDWLRFALPQLYYNDQQVALVEGSFGSVYAYKISSDVRLTGFLSTNPGRSYFAYRKVPQEGSLANYLDIGRLSNGGSAGSATVILGDFYIGNNKCRLSIGIDTDPDNTIYMYPAIIWVDQHLSVKKRNWFKTLYHMFKKSWQEHRYETQVQTESEKL